MKGGKSVRSLKVSNIESWNYVYKAPAIVRSRENS